MKNKVLDTSGWREFRIGDLFEKIKTNKLDFKATDLKDKNDELYNLPALTAGVENQGLAYYVPKNNATILKNVISVSANGANAGITFYQPNEFTVLQDSYAIQFIDENMRNKTTKLQYLFIVSIFQSNIKPKFDWKIKAGWDRFKNESIKLPVDSKGNIDWDFMEKSIKETKKEVEKILQSYKALKASTSGGGGGNTS
ncbi:restriction endonuclease subunit S [uncultured Helicobacter sp.]|uniref:restriction endonuclease subunit S n=1 Tax=uncultured Helicobacter sp. TaxID=175537 RepID=UPI00374EA8A1